MNVTRKYVEDRDTYTLIVDGVAMGTVDTTRDHTGDVLARRAAGEIVAPRFSSHADAEAYLMGGDRPSLCVNDGSCIRATGHNGEHQDSNGRVWGRALPIRTEVRRDGLVGTVVSTHGPSRGLRNGEVYVSWSGGSAWRTPEIVNVESLTGTYAKCVKVACYNAGNGRECWTVTHLDGTRSYEYPNEDAAREAAKLPSRDNANERNHMSWC